MLHFQLEEPVVLVRTIRVLAEHGGKVLGEDSVESEV